MKSVENRFDVHTINTTIGVEVYFPKMRGSKTRNLSIPTAMLAAGENKVYGVFDSDERALCGPQLKHCREYISSHRKGKLLEGKITKVYHTLKLVGTAAEEEAYREACRLAHIINQTDPDGADFDELHARFEAACKECHLPSEPLMWGAK